MIIVIKQVPEASPNADGEWVIRTKGLQMSCNDMMILLSIYRCSTQSPDVPGLPEGDRHIL